MVFVQTFLLEVLHKSTHGPIFSLQTYSVFVPSPFMAMWELNMDGV